MNIVIRAATENDFQSIQHLSQELTISDSIYDPILVKEWAYTKEGITYLHKRISGRRCICIVAEVNGKIVGYTTATIMKPISWRPGKHVEMENLIVDKAFRNQGIGAKLIEAFFVWARKVKADFAEVHSYYNNERAQALYKRSSFVPLSVSLETKLT